MRAFSLSVWRVRDMPRSWQRAPNDRGFSNGGRSGAYKQLAEWRAEKASESTSQGYVAEESAFYTGKPYLASTGGYAFKYRSYSPELARWTSEDPSGFPDGANGNIYAPSPTMELDYQGLSKTVIDWKLHEVDITNNYTLSQQKLDVGMDPTNPLFMTDAAYQTFQNTIRRR